MKKDEIFFGDNGLTSTSANFIANLAKEMYKGLESELTNLHLFSTKVGLISGEKDRYIQKGVSSIDTLDQKLKDIADLKSLIAWLREAITARENLIVEAKSDTFGIEAIPTPVRDTPINANDVIGTFSIKERNNYFHLETICSVLGKFIHPDGTLDRERSRLHLITSTPHQVEGTGSNTLIYTYEPTISVKEVDSKFASLQQLYREKQAQLNSIKHQIETAVLKDETEKNERYRVAYDEYRRADNYRQIEIQNKRNAEIERISKLKIVIPDSLKQIFEKVQNFGKNK